jgi:hypothetical protein
LPRKKPEPAQPVMPSAPARAAYAPGEAELAMASLTEGVRACGPIVRTARAHPYDNVLPNLSVRDGSDGRDYDAFRRGERDGDPLVECQRAYTDVPVVRNTVDLMSDFCVQGMDLVHPNPEVENFYKEWFKKVKGRERSERIINTSLRLGTAVVVREREKLRRKQERDLKRGVAAPEPVKVEAREIPWRYSVLSPLTVEAVAPELDPFLNGSPGLYAVKLPQEVVNLIRKPRNQAERDLVTALPQEVLDAARSDKRGTKSVPIAREKVAVLHYKKDDGAAWGLPILHSIRGACALYRKAVLADMAALDGAMSQIRVWKLGNLEYKIFPTQADVDRLKELLMSNTAGGVLDVIWRPDLEVFETKNEGWRFLTSDKYKQVMADIYAGLGVPPTLTGTGEGGGTTNNLTSIKTLVERLEYARMLLEEFWREEVKQVQLAMGFRFPARLVYDRMALSDEAAELALLIQLADRDMLSVEYLQERFGAIPEIEQVRLRREGRMRKRKLIPAKAGPWHDPEKDHKKEMAFIGKGMLAPNQAGMNVPAPDKSKVYTDPQPKPAAGGKPAGKLKGRPGQGRPKNSKDGQKRKKKRFVPAGASLAAAVAGADEAQRKIAEWAQPLFLAHLGKANLRQLTDAEAAEFEDLKFDLLFALGGADATGANLEGAAARVAEGAGATDEARAAVAGAAQKFERAGGKSTLDRLRGIRAAVYASIVCAA